MTRLATPMLLIILLVLAISACRVRVSVSDSGTPTGTQESQAQRANEFFNSFTDKDFTSVTEAEQVAGFRIPQPDGSYPRASNRTILRWFSGERRPTAESQYTYVPKAPTSIGLTVGPAYDWDRKDGTSGEVVLSYGTPMRIGQRDGFFTHSQGGFEFSFHCGTVDGVAVWCIVRTTDRIGRAAFDAFVSSIQ